MSRFSRPRLLPLARALAVAWLCLAAPAVHQAIVETASWLSGADCCADDCDESGAPCTQQCTHCVCGSHSPTLSSPERTGLALAREVQRSEGATAQDGARSGHLERPFRPPVS